MRESKQKQPLPSIQTASIQTDRTHTKVTQTDSIQTDRIQTPNPGKQQPDTRYLEDNLQREDPDRSHQIDRTQKDLVQIDRIRPTGSRQNR